jgi:hypothetical protein
MVLELAYLVSELDLRARVLGLGTYGPLAFGELLEPADLDPRTVSALYEAAAVGRVRRARWGMPKS